MTINAKITIEEKIVQVDRTESAKVLRWEQANVV